MSPRAVTSAVLAVDRWQGRNRFAGPTYGLVKKFGDDHANLFVVGLGWYGFTAIFPLLLVVVTVFGYLGAGSLGRGIVHTLHEFPVIGSQFRPARSNLHGNPLGLVVGLAGLLYGAQGVTQVAQQAMSRAWGQPQTERPGFVPRLLRSLAGLAAIGSAFVVTAFVGALATASGRSPWLRVLLLTALALLNVALYLLAFAVLTSSRHATVRALVPGAVLGGLAFTLLTTIGTGLMEHQLRHSDATYGALASVIGVVAYLLVLGKISVYAAELNPVLSQHLWPRALPRAPRRPADEEVLRQLAMMERRSPDEWIEASFAPPAEWNDPAAVSAGVAGPSR